MVAGLGRAAVGRAAIVLAAAALSLLLLPTGAASQGGDNPSILEEGETAYNGSCAGCHGPDGTGTELGRSLIDIAVQEPNRQVHIDSVVDGKGGMPALGEVVAMEDIESAVTYVRLTFGGASADELPLTGPTATSWIAAAGVLMMLSGVATVWLGPAARR